MPAPTPPTKREQIAVRINRDDLAEVDRYAQAEHRTRSDMVRVLLLEAMAARRKKEGNAMSTEQSTDWTAEDGRANSSPLFLALVRDVERMIRDGAHDLITGRAGTVARVIVANLAHRHGLTPTGKPEDARLACAESSAGAAGTLRSAALRALDLAEESPQPWARPVALLLTTIAQQVDETTREIGEGVERDGDRTDVELAALDLARVVLSERWQV